MGDEDFDAVDVFSIFINSFVNATAQKIIMDLALRRLGFA